MAYYPIYIASEATLDTLAKIVLLFSWSANLSNTEENTPIKQNDPLNNVAQPCTQPNCLEPREASRSWQLQ